MKCSNMIGENIKWIHMVTGLHATCVKQIRQTITYINACVLCKSIQTDKFKVKYPFNFQLHISV